MAENLSWNIQGLGKMLDYSAKNEGQFVLSPAFELEDGSIYALKFTPFPKRGKLGESSLTIAAIPNPKEQKAGRMDRVVGRIVLKTFKILKSAAAKPAARYLG
jgi:hypothetical protein